MSDKFFWLFLEPDIHVSLKGGKALLYNPGNGTVINLSQASEVMDVVQRLIMPENNYVIKLSGEQSANPAIAGFINALKKNFMGDVLDASWGEGRPFQMMPMPKVKRDFFASGGYDIQDAEEDALSYLKRISFQVTGKCSQDCLLCKDAYKQFGYCFKSPEGSEDLELSFIEILLPELEKSTVSCVSVSGGDLLDYPGVEPLVAMLGALKVEKRFYSNLLNVKRISESLLGLLRANDFQLNLTLHFPFDRKAISDALQKIRNADVRLKVIIALANQAECNELEEIEEFLDSVDYSMHPYFNGKNLPFFEEAVFVDRDDIIGTKPSQQTIFSRMKCNELGFGNLFVKANGDVYANVNHDKLGNIKQDTISRMVLREIEIGKSWRTIRNDVTPCRDCNYQYLCPPISNYEYVMKKFNLCKMNED